MPEYMVYNQGQRPWFDEVRWLTQSQLYEAIQEAAEVHLRKMTPDELVQFASTHFGVNVDVRS